MNIEPVSKLRLEHPGRDAAQLTVRTQNGEDLFTVAEDVALADNAGLPMIRVVPVVDRDLFTKLWVGTM
jgi:hypothetical protein